MALIVEDGTGTVAGADSYVSRADADTYHANHGNPSEWSGASEDARDGALRAATVWLNGHYRGDWPGAILLKTQPLPWPRSSAYDLEGRTLSGLPQAIIDAVCELALAHLETPLNEAQGQRVRSERVGSVAVEYAPGSSGEESFPQVERILADIVNGAGSAVIPAYMG